MVSRGVTPAGNNSRSDLPKGGLFCAEAAPARMPPSVQFFPNSPHVCLPTNSMRVTLSKRNKDKPRMEEDERG
jgi:hypothetical protein